MKNFQIYTLFVVILLATSFSIFAQDSKQASRYSNDLYKIAFQIPSDSAKQAESTEQRTIFTGEKSKFGSTARLEFVIDEQNAADKLSQLLSTDEGMEALANALVRKLKGKSTDFEFVVLEKKRVQIAGLNGFKLVTSAVLPNGKVRSAMFVVPVPEQKRMYSFIIAAPDTGFDKWFPNAEVSVTSFELLETKK